MIIKRRKNISDFDSTYKNDITFVAIDGGCSFITYYMLKSFVALKLNVNFYILCLVVGVVDQVVRYGVARPLHADARLVVRHHLAEMADVADYFWL